MTNRLISAIIQDQNPLVLTQSQSVKEACAAMREKRTGSVLVVDDKNSLKGIFTGRDAVRLLAGERSKDARLGDVMTPNPRTIAPGSRAVDALRMMCEGGFRHLPVVDGGRILGIVSRNDFKGMEIDQLDVEERLSECIW